MNQKGFFLIRPLDNKAILKLKGDFDGNNIHLIRNAMLLKKVLSHNYLELDMSRVETINMQAMALLSINLKRLRDSGTKTRVTGLDKTKCNLAKELGMQFITQIN